MAHIFQQIVQLGGSYRHYSQALSVRLLMIGQLLKVNQLLQLSFRSRHLSLWLDWVWNIFLDFSFGLLGGGAENSCSRRAWEQER